MNPGLNVLIMVPFTSVYLRYSIDPMMVTVALLTQAYCEGKSGNDVEVLRTRPGAKPIPFFAMRQYLPSLCLSFSTRVSACETGLTPKFILSSAYQQCVP